MLCYWGAQVREGLGLLKPEEVNHSNCGIRSICPKSAVQDISAGRSFIGFIHSEKVSVLRLRGEDAHDELEPLQEDGIRSIVCAGAGAVLLADGGKVLIMDKSIVCRPLKGLDNRQVIQIACGDHHSMALTNDGQLFVWGENSHGQLGLKKDLAGTHSAQHVQSLCGIPVAQISAGGNHSFVLSLSGVVFGWGNNSAGQLGLGDTTDRFVPTIVKSLSGKKTVSISCGGEHTATLSQGGTVFTFGSGGFGQLGHNSLKDEDRPRLVAELWGSEVSQVTCGRHHTLVLVASSNLIYSFGCGMHGQLGNGEMVNQTLPFPVHLPTECDHEYTIEKLIAGENHSFALFYKRQLESKPKNGPSKRVLMVDDKMIDRWVSGCVSWATIKNEINTVFSSAACLNGSFLKTSCDEHYKTSVEHCGLDFDLVKTSFAKLLENKSLISEVVKAIQQSLLPSLKPNPTGVEALRLYLLLPELIDGLKKHKTTLTEALASKILQLNPDARKVLEMYWSTLPDDWLKGLVKLFHNESTDLICQISSGETEHELTRHLKNFLEILQMAYEVCCSNNINETNHGFIIHEISDLLDTLQAITTHLVNLALCFQIEDFNDTLKLEDYYIKTVKILVKFPFAVDFVSKQRMFNFLQEQNIRKLIEQMSVNFNANLLSVNRESLLMDTLRYLRQDTHSFVLQLKVAFIGENGMDYRGLSAEFFSLLSKALLEWDKNVLKVHESSLVWFNPDHKRGKRDFYYLGVIYGMALYNRHYINIDFPLALFKKLLQQKPTLDDLKELSPVEARGLKDLLEADEDVVNLLDLDFTVNGQELIPNGSQIQVNKANRQKYVDLYVDLVFNKSVKTQFDQFVRGFSKGCPLDVWSVFHPEELQELLHGSYQYKWKELQQSASYEGCSASDQLLKNFWTVFFELSEENKKKFLMFLYGTESVPAGGFTKRCLKISLSDCPDPDDHLPEAQTCFGRLILPKYRDINTLRKKITHAINFCKVFGQG